MSFVGREARKGKTPPRAQFYPSGPPGPPELAPVQITYFIYFFAS